MATRAQVRFATREEGVTFSEHPEKIHAQFYVHNDGYPSFLGVEIANSILDSTKIDNLEIEYLDTIRGDLNYIYYVWQSPGKTTWISIFHGDGDEFTDKWECIFVGEPQKLLEKYDQD
jgi:hypothetical protein